MDGGPRVSGLMRTLRGLRASSPSLRLLMLLVLAAVLAACSLLPSQAGPTPNPADPADPTDPAGPVDATGDWRLTAGTVDGAAFPLDDRWPVTLMIDGTTVGGTGACNGYGGEIVVRDGEVRFGEMGMTAMGCEPEVMAIESAYHAALARIRIASMDGDALILAGDGVSLRFEPIAPVPMADLIDTDWTLDSLIAGGAVSSVAGEPGTLILHGDGRFEGSTGCRTFSGRYQEIGGEIVATDMAMDDRACLPALADQDGHVTTVLGDGFSAVIDGDRLTLTSAGGNGLVYVAAP